MLVGANADVIDPGDLGYLPQTVDLGVDLGAEFFGALSDVHGSIGRHGDLP
jgi:hypothetical protein